MEHGNIGAGYIHPPYNWVFGNNAARIAAGSYVTADVGKIAYQSDIAAYFVLTAITPTWRPWATLPAFTWAARPSASEYGTGAEILITDIASYYVRARSNGANWALESYTVPIVSTPVTGTTAETITSVLTFPAGVFAGGIYDLTWYGILAKTGTAGTQRLELRLGTVGSGLAGSLIEELAAQAAVDQQANLLRDQLVISSATQLDIGGYNKQLNTAAYTPIDTTSIVNMHTTAFDLTHTIVLGDATDSAKISVGYVAIRHIG